jgi:hypothetical protein
MCRVFRLAPPRLGLEGNYLRQEAFRSGGWKLLRSYEYLGDRKWSAEHKDELFNLREDMR